MHPNILIKKVKTIFHDRTWFIIKISNSELIQNCSDDENNLIHENESTWFFKVATMHL